VGYRANDSGQIELWVWPGLDIASRAVPARYPVLNGVSRFELRYFTRASSWVDAWPALTLDAAVPRAVQMRIVLTSGEEIVRTFALRP
jgi:general secretion pathway protein J